MEENFIITSSWWAGSGLFIFALFLFIFLSTSFAFVVLAIKPKVVGWSRREGIFYALIVICFSAIMSSIFLPYFCEFTTLTITETGSWKLKNGWGITLVTIAESQPRRVLYGSEHVTWYGKAYESYDTSRLYVVTDKRIYPSWTENNEQKIKSILNDLTAVIEQNNLPISTNETKPFSMYQALQYVRYGLWGVLMVIMLLPLLIFRKK
jgi:hypothetical protein